MSYVKKLLEGLREGSPKEKLSIEDSRKFLEDKGKEAIAELCKILNKPEEGVSYVEFQPNISGNEGYVFDVEISCEVNRDDGDMDIFDQISETICRVFGLKDDDGWDVSDNVYSFCIYWRHYPQLDRHCLDGHAPGESNVYNTVYVKGNLV